MSQTKEDEKNDFVYPSGYKLALLLMSIYVSMLLVALVCTAEHNLLKIHTKTLSRLMRILCRIG